MNTIRFFSKICLDCFKTRLSITFSSLVQIEWIKSFHLEKKHFYEKKNWNFYFDILWFFGTTYWFHLGLTIGYIFFKVLIEIKIIFPKKRCVFLSSKKVLRNHNENCNRKSLSKTNFVSKADNGTLEDCNSFPCHCI